MLNRLVRKLRRLKGRTLCGAYAAIPCCSNMKPSLTITWMKSLCTTKPHNVKCRQCSEPLQVGYGIRDFAMSGTLEKNTLSFCDNLGYQIEVFRFWLAGARFSIDSVLVEPALSCYCFRACYITVIFSLLTIAFCSAIFTRPFIT